MIKIIFNIFCKNKSVHKMIFEITKLKNLRISFHKYKCMFYLKDSPLPAFMMQSILMAKNQFKSNNCEKIFGIECNWNNIDQFCKYAHKQTWKLKSTTLLVWGWFQYRGSKYQTVYHKKNNWNSYYLYWNVHLFFSRSNILHPAMLLFTDIEKGFIYIHYPCYSLFSRSTCIGTFNNRCLH